MMQIISEVRMDDFERACKEAGMERTEACHPDEPFHHCRSDEWRGNLMAFALAIVRYSKQEPGKLRFDQ